MENLELVLECWTNKDECITLLKESGANVIEIAKNISEDACVRLPVQYGAALLPYDTVVKARISYINGEDIIVCTASFGKEQMLYTYNNDKNIYTGLLFVTRQNGYVGTGPFGTKRQAEPLSISDSSKCFVQIFKRIVKANFIDANQ